MYDLYYWPAIQGRGEFVRLALEATGAPYRDVSREDGGKTMMALMKPGFGASFAPPFLRQGERTIGQVAAILAWIGPQLGLAPNGDSDRAWLNQIQLTFADLVVEVHDTHHPVDLAAFYEDQKVEAVRRSRGFCKDRMPKFLNWSESLLTTNPSGSGWLVGKALTYADLSLFQIVEGLRYAFPHAADWALDQTPSVVALHDRVAALPRIAAYLESDRRIPFNEDGIFRHYPELDAPALTA